MPLLIHKMLLELHSLRRQLAFRGVAAWALAGRCPGNERRIFHTDDVWRHYPDLGSASDWLKPEGISFQPIRSAEIPYW